MYNSILHFIENDIKDYVITGTHQGISEEVIGLCRKARQIPRYPLRVGDHGADGE